MVRPQCCKYTEDKEYLHLYLLMAEGKIIDYADKEFLKSCSQFAGLKEEYKPIIL